MSLRPSSRKSDGKLGIGLVLLFVVGIIGACVHQSNLNASKAGTEQNYSDKRFEQ